MNYNKLGLALIVLLAGYAAALSTYNFRHSGGDPVDHPPQVGWSCRPDLHPNVEVAGGAPVVCRDRSMTTAKSGDHMHLVMQTAMGATVFTDGEQRASKALCPDGTRVIGGGYVLTAGKFTPGVPVAPLISAPDPRGWWIQPVHVPGSHIGFAAYATCASSVADSAMDASTGGVAKIALAG
jgi:hypothetical protein